MRDDIIQTEGSGSHHGGPSASHSHQVIESHRSKMSSHNDYSRKFVMICMRHFHTTNFPFFCPLSLLNAASRSLAG